MNIFRSLRLLPLAMLFALGSCDKEVAGTTDEHETNVAARLFLPDGSPAAGARVRIFAVGDTTEEERDQVFATSDGSVVLPELPAGKYNLVATDDAGKGVVIDSLLSTGAGVPSMRNDTLRSMGYLKGCLQVEPQNSPNIAWAQILGLGLATNVDAAGCFLMEVPAGRVTLAALTRDTSYTPTFRSVRTIPDSTLDVGVVRLNYTGIPVVQGLAVEYDSMGGIAAVRWNRALAYGLRGYVLFGPSRGPIVLDDLSDTTWFDTLFRPDSFATAAAQREYYVVAADSSRMQGQPWRRVSLAAPSPWTIPRGDFRDTILGTVPFNGFDELDTLAGGLVCFRQRIPANGGLHLLHRSDTVDVSVSTDGKIWRDLPRFAGVLRVVAWRGRIWATRGIPSGETAMFANTNGDSLRNSDGTLVGAPRYRGVVVESWTVDGSLVRADTLLDPRGALCYQLFAAGDTLVLTRDSAANTATGPAGPSGVMAIPLDTRRLVDVDGGWVEESGRGLDLKLEWWRLNWLNMERMQMNSRGGMSLFTEDDPEIVFWGNLEWDEFGGELFARDSNEAFPWYASSVVGSRIGYRYRGDGEHVPPFIVWKGCLLHWNAADHALRGLRSVR